eukprot:6200923-Pleurochrysis_carterae.AAC.3
MEARVLQPSRSPCWSDSWSREPLSNSFPQRMEWPQALRNLSFLWLTVVLGLRQVSTYTAGRLPCPSSSGLRDRSQCIVR